MFYHCNWLILSCSVCERGSYPGFTFAVEALDSLQACCDGRKTRNQMSCTLDLLYQNTFDLGRRLQGLDDSVDLFTVVRNGALSLSVNATVSSALFV